MYVYYAFCTPWLQSPTCRIVYAVALPVLIMHSGGFRFTIFDIPQGSGKLKAWSFPYSNTIWRCKSFLKSTRLCQQFLEFKMYEFCFVKKCISHTWFLINLYLRDKPYEVTVQVCTLLKTGFRSVDEPIASNPSFLLCVSNVPLSAHSSVQFKFPHVKDPKKIKMIPLYAWVTLSVLAGKKNKKT